MPLLTNSTSASFQGQDSTNTRGKLNYSPLDSLMELCPLSELLRLSTEPPGFSLGFSKQSESVCGKWARLETWSGLDWWAERAETTCSESAGSDRCRTDCCAYLFWNRTVVSLGYMFPHCLSHRLDFFAQRDAGSHWRPNGISETVPVFVLKGIDECGSVRRKVIWAILTLIKQEKEEQLTGESSEMAAWTGRFIRSNPPKLQALWFWKKCIKTLF